MTFTQEGWESIWSPVHLARMRVSYGDKSGPNAGSRASSPGEQAAACDYIRTRELGRGASRSLRLHKNSCAGPGSKPQLATAKQLVSWAGEQAAACDYIKTRALGRGASR